MASRVVADHLFKVLLGPVDEIIDRVADVLEAVGARLTKVSDLAIAEPPPRLLRQGAADFTVMLARVGRNGLRAANARGSLASEVQP